MPGNRCSRSSTRSTSVAPLACTTRWSPVSFRNGGGIRTLAIADLPLSPMIPVLERWTRVPLAVAPSGSRAVELRNGSFRDRLTARPPDCRSSVHAIPRPPNQVQDVPLEVAQGRADGHRRRDGVGHGLEGL